jgi:methylphosphotriester-DNA--protein-cysteine methyltransferase
MDYCTDTERLAAVYACDPGADGRFWYGVTSTRIFCRPSCPSRAPRPERVLFFSTAAEARAAGFRPCKRCRPDAAPPEGELTASLEAAAAELRERCAEDVSWREAAARACMSPSHFHRLFRRHTGTTPSAYLALCRVRRAQELLRRGDRSVLQIAYESGFASPAAFYRAFARLTGASPAAFRARNRSVRP